MKSEQKSSENDLNPWEPTPSESSNADRWRLPTPRVVPFSGTLDPEVVIKWNRIPLQVGFIIAVALPLFGLLIPVAMAGSSITVVGFTLAALMFLLIAGAIFFGAMNKKFWLNELNTIRPWLLGPMHGVVSAGRLTVWHNDVCIQTNDPAFLNSTNHAMMSYPVLYNQRSFPWILVPSVCFFGQDWHEVLGDHKRLRSAGSILRSFLEVDAIPIQPLVVESPPSDAWENILPAHRANRLVIWMRSSLTKDRLKAEKGFQYRKYPMVAPEVPNNFLDPGRPILQWFNRETILFQTKNHWVRIPTTHVHFVIITERGILFGIYETWAPFYREGFADEDSWQGACQIAFQIQEAIPPKKRFRRYR